MVVGGRGGGGGEALRRISGPLAVPSVSLVWSGLGSVQVALGARLLVAPTPRPGPSSG